MGVGVDVLMRDAKLGDNAGGGRQERASRERDHATTRAKRDTGSGAHDALQLGAPRGQSRVSEPAIHSTSTSVSQAHKTQCTNMEFILRRKPDQTSHSSGWAKSPIL
jgi:hypothetical protein